MAKKKLTEAEMKLYTYTVLRPILGDDAYAAGDSIELTEGEAGHLLATGAIAITLVPANAPETAV